MFHSYVSLPEGNQSTKIWAWHEFHHLKNLGIHQAMDEAPQRIYGGSSAMCDLGMNEACHASMWLCLNHGNLFIPVCGILWEDDDPYMLSGFLKLCIYIIYIWVWSLQLQLVHQGSLHTCHVFPLLFYNSTVVGSLSQPVANAWRLFLEKAAAPLGAPFSGCGLRGP